MLDVGGREARGSAIFYADDGVLCLVPAMIELHSV